jgi:hypothetical protein
MSAYVLILYLATGSVSSGMATTAAEFETLEACKAAGEQARGAFSSFATSVKFICVRKGGELRPKLP